LLKSTRQQYHCQIAQVWERRFPETTETQPELLAHHYTEAGLIEQAILYWQRAGERATQRSAYIEAIAHLTRGLEVLKTLPDIPERARQELTLQLALNEASFPVKGYTAPEVVKTVTRARELCQQIGETRQLFPVLYRLWQFYAMSSRGELQTAHELAEQCFSLAQSVQDPYLLMTAHGALEATLYWLGELTSAQPHLEQAMALYHPQQPPRSVVATGDPRLDCRGFAAWTLWQLGYPDQALQRSHEAVALAEELSHPFGLAYTLGAASLFHLFRREGQLARERAEALITLSTEQRSAACFFFHTSCQDLSTAVTHHDADAGPARWVSRPHGGWRAWSGNDLAWLHGDAAGRACPRSRPDGRSMKKLCVIVRAGR
jgi:tetratricopeptide (TPR) repeat protein